MSHLYEQHKWKKHYHQVQQTEQQRISDLASAKKISPNSAQILNYKLYVILDEYDDEQMVNLETCIPILYHIGILQILTDIEEAKTKLQNGTHDNFRLKAEAKFIYCMWKMINHEEIETRDLKELLYMLNDKNGNDLKNILQEMFGNENDVHDLVEAWRQLNQDRQYYTNKAKHSIKHDTHAIRQDTHAIRQDTHPIKQGTRSIKHDTHLIKLDTNKENMTQDLSQDDEKVYRQHVRLRKTQPIQAIEVNSGKKSTKRLDYSLELDDSQRNAIILSQSQEKQLVSRLYNKDKYKIREELHKAKKRQQEKEAVSSCTFQPQLITKSNPIKRKNSLSCDASRSDSKPKIKGYEKAVSRMKLANRDHDLKKKLQKYHSVGENYEKIKNKGINPPKFLGRQKKEEETVLFFLEFEFGRNKVKVPVRPTDTQDSIANSLCRIYCLKSNFYEQISSVVRTQLHCYYKELASEQEISII